MPMWTKTGREHDEGERKRGNGREDRGKETERTKEGKSTSALPTASALQASLLILKLWGNFPSPAYSPQRARFFPPSVSGRARSSERGDKLPRNTCAKARGEGEGNRSGVSFRNALVPARTHGRGCSASPREPRAGIMYVGLAGNSKCGIITSQLY